MYKIYKLNQINKIAEELLAGKIGVLPTDTIYGIHCIASNDFLMKRVYELKERSEGFPFITLVQNVDEIENFGVFLNTEMEEITKSYWPGPNTLIFEANDGTTKSFRVPRNDFLNKLLRLTGPLISTSANVHGKPSAKNVDEAIAYFGEKIDFYVDSGTLDNPPSSIYKILKDKVEKIR